MKAVLLSIQPKWCELIASGRKTVEVRKTKPKLETPFKCYIYCTVGGVKKMPRDYLAEYFERGKIIGEFLCKKVDKIAHCGTCNNDIRLRVVNENLTIKGLDYSYLNKCQLSYTNIDKYSNGYGVYGWHISDLVIYDKSRDLSEFEVRIENKVWSYTKKLIKPPQNWRYIERSNLF